MRQDNAKVGMGRWGGGGKGGEEEKGGEGGGGGIGTLSLFSRKSPTNCLRNSTEKSSACGLYLLSSLPNLTARISGTSSSVIPKKLTTRPFSSSSVSMCKNSACPRYARATSRNASNFSDTPSAVPFSNSNTCCFKDPPNTFGAT